MLVSFVCAAIGEIEVYVDGMNGLMRCSEVIEWLYSLTGSKVGIHYLGHGCTGVQHLVDAFNTYTHTHTHAYVCIHTHAHTH